MKPKNGGVGGEFFFYELLRPQNIHLVRANLNSFALKSVLDIGCGDCRALIGMHFQCGSTMLHGFDAKESNDVLSEDLLGGRPSSIGGAYESIARRLYGALDYDGQLRLNLQSLLGDVEYGTPLQHYQLELSYDAIICSHVLHFQRNEQDLRDMLGLIARHRSPEGLVYVSLKDGYHKKDSSVIPGDHLLKPCFEWSKEMRLTYLPSHREGDEGQAHVFTNLK